MSVISWTGKRTEKQLKGEAMTVDQLTRTMDAGKKAVDRAMLQKAQLFIPGEMGIENTTSARAIACAATTEITGAGIGLDDREILRKTAIIESAFLKHGAKATIFWKY